MQDACQPDDGQKVEECGSDEDIYNTGLTYDDWVYEGLDDKMIEIIEEEMKATKKEMAEAKRREKKEKEEREKNQGKDEESESSSSEASNDDNKEIIERSQLALKKLMISKPGTEANVASVKEKIEAAKAAQAARIRPKTESIKEMMVGMNEESEAKEEEDNEKEAEEEVEEETEKSEENSKDIEM